MNYLKKCARHFLDLKTSFSWNDPIISTAKWVVPYKQETSVVFIHIHGKKIFSLTKSISFDIHRENVPSAKLPQMMMPTWGNVPNFSLTPIRPGYPQLGCYQYHQPIILGSL